MRLNLDDEENTMRRFLLGGLMLGLAAIGIFGLPKLSCAQDKPKGDSAHSSDDSVYRLEFSVVEIADGKRLNSRTYVMSIANGNNGSIRVGNRVPYATSAGPTKEPASVQYQYEDVGIAIDCTLRERENYVLLRNVGIDISSVVKENASQVPNPVFRGARARVDVAVTPGKPTTVTSLDDVSSNHRYEVEVTATKVK
jgi:hypothetical protein